MTDSFKTNKRLGIKVPRSTLLPPYLASNPYFVEFTDAVDSVFSTSVDSATDALANIRNMWVQSPDTEAFVQEQQLVPKEAWALPDRDLVVKQVNMLGMKLFNAGVVTDDAYQTIARFVGMYWFGKGTQGFIEFINYCLSSDLQVQNMWTENYDDFFPEGDPAIGTPIWDGGTWYPTTHVTIVAKGGLKGLDIRTLQSFFYEIANYNLVLLAIDANYDMKVVDNVGKIEANIVAMALFGMSNIVIANFKNKGAPPPPTNILETNKLPTTYYAMGGVSIDTTQAILLGEPSGWLYIDDDNTKKVPIYNLGSQTITDEGDIGIKLLGNPKPVNHYDLVVGVISWVKIPGSPRSTARIPVFSTSSFTIKDEGFVEARMVGVHRTKLLANPVGFFDMGGGNFAPYW